MASVIFDNTNTDGVQNTPTAPTIFGLAQPTLITRVSLYFFNAGAGPNPAITVMLRDVGINATFGPFVPLLSAGQWGAANVNVEIFPNTVLPPGRYQILPDQANAGLWSQNARSGGQGFARVEGTMVPAKVADPPINQYERANWATNFGRPQRILWLQPVGVAATYLAIYRITNGDTSTVVTVQTDGGSFTLEPGVSADVSTQKIEISSTLPAWGTYQDICCALATVAPQAPKPPPKDDKGAPPPVDEPPPA
jgi:hypothetical protein